jgi:hypothetical protein
MGVGTPQRPDPVRLDHCDPIHAAARWTGHNRDVNIASFPFTFSFCGEQRTLPGAFKN